MALNPTPVYGGTPVNAWDAAGVILTANTAKDGTGTVQTIFTAGADGAFVERIVARAAGTNVATVLRVFLNNGSTNATAANNKLIHEVSLPATTLSETSSTPAIVEPMNVRLAPNYKLLITVGTTVAAGWHVSALGASYTAV